MYDRHDAMSVILIQIQPGRAPGIDLALIRAAAAQLGATELFTRYGEEEGFDKGAYINLFFDPIDGEGLGSHSLNSL